jgi:acyl-CoA synthetase (AMP-forming)/AMP-acid ligase II
MKPTPIAALIQQAQARPKATAFIFHGKVWTYEKIATESERLARGMIAHGVKPGDRVALHMMNRPEYIVAYYACFRIGAIAAPLRTLFTFAELAPLLQRLEPKLYIGEASLYDNVAPVDGAILPRDKRFIIDAIAPGHDGMPWEKLFNVAESIALPGSPVVTDPAVLINTSGTTGQPKFVIHTPATLAESTELMVQNCNLSVDDAMPLALPMAHISGLVASLTCIRGGMFFILMESFDPDVVLDTIERHRCTIQFGFPANYAALLARQTARPRNLKSLRYCATGGDACPIELQQQVASSFGAPLYNFWGATEVIGNVRFVHRVGPVIGIPTDAEIRLIDDNRKDVADGEAGELLIRAPNVFAGYWNDPRATAEAVQDGWYHTGDLMRREGDELVFVARKKEIIIRGGTNISPVEIEQAIFAAHPAVKEAAVVGVADAVLGQRVFGFVTLGKGCDAAVVPEILGRLTTRLAAYKIPEVLAVLETLPRNALSKVDRKTLQSMATRADEAHQAEMVPEGFQVERMAERSSRRAITIGQSR